MLQYHRFISLLIVSIVITACGGGVDVEPVEGSDGPPPVTTGTVEIKLADPSQGVLTSMSIDFSRITGPLEGLIDSQGLPLASGVRPTDLARICYMSNRTGWNEQALACTNIHAGTRPRDFVCYDEHRQPSACPDAWLGDSGRVDILWNLRNNDRGMLMVQVATTGLWYALDQGRWPCIGATACVTTTDFLMEYGGYRPATGQVSCVNGVPIARVHFGTDAIAGFGPALQAGEAGQARWNSNTVGWTEMSLVSGSLGRDANGDYFFELTGMPVSEADGTFTIRNNRNGEWSWMDPTAFTWNRSVTVDTAMYHIAYDLGSCS